MSIPMNEDNTWIKLNDEVLDDKEIVKDLAQKAENREEKLSPGILSIPPFGTASEMPNPPLDLPHSFDLYSNLRLFNENYYRAETHIHLADSPAINIPIFGPIWKRVRQFAHNLVIYYVNRHIAHQNQINFLMTNILNELTRENEKLKRQLRELQK